MPTEFIPIEQAAANGHTDGRTVLLKSADEVAEGVYDADECEPGWVLLRGIDNAEQMCPQPTHYRLIA
jgi:hypothetical protein